MEYLLHSSLLHDYGQSRKPKIFKDRIFNFEKFDDEEFIDRFRISKEVCLYLLDLIQDEIVSNTEKNLAVKPLDQLLVALQYYASGSFMRCVGDMAGLHKTTVCRVVHRVTMAIAKLRPQFIRMPSTDEELNATALQFYDLARFPKVLGAIDGTHIPILSPGGDQAEDFRNRKGSFSLNIQVIGDANLRIRNIVARWPGSAHDSHVFNSSNIKHKLEAGEFQGFWLLGDSGYACKPYLLTPLANPQTRGARLYNESQIRTRTSIERLFGVWKRRFPILGIKIKCHIKNVQPIIVATAILYNLCREFNVRQPLDFITIDDTNTSMPQEIVDGTDSDVTSNNGLGARENLINNYFSRL